MIFWQSYLNQFTDKYDLLKDGLLENTHEEIGPFLGAKDRRYPASAPFGMDWAAIYQDGKYFRVKEAYNRIGKPSVGAGVRATFSLHYGKAHTDRDRDGFPRINDVDTPPADLRIDFDKWGAHIHLGSRDHIPQSRIQGYSISDADVFEFLEAVIEHRRSHTPLHQLLGIKVI